MINPPPQMLREVRKAMQPIMGDKALTDEQFTQVAVKIIAIVKSYVG